MNWPPRPADHTPDKTGKPDEPWLTRDAILFLEELLDGTQRVLEYGSGGSTLWYGRRAKRVESIEHDNTWASTVSRAILEGNHFNVCLYHIPNTDDYETYSRFGRELAKRDGPFDLVVVDGRGRVKCVKASAELVKPGGYLVLDNAERPNYAEAHRFLSGWFSRRTENGIWRTDIFRR